MVDKMDTGFWVGIPENILTGQGEQESPESFFPHFIKVGEYMRVRRDIGIHIFINGCRVRIESRGVVVVK